MRKFSRKKVKYQASVAKYLWQLKNKFLDPEGESEQHTIVDN